MHRVPARLVSLALLVVGIGCGGPDVEPEPDGGLDGGADERDSGPEERDSGPEVRDSGEEPIDARADAAEDAGGGDDAAPDAPMGDAGSDAGPCAGCDDGIACTLDTCEVSRCEHLAVHGECEVGEYCDPASGCRAGAACATTADCTRPDTCVTVACNAAMARCTYTVLDGDGDGHAPTICGGDDCNDAVRWIHGSAAELCDRMDQDCDGTVDEDNATTTACGDLSTCTEGACSCPRELDWCLGGFLSEGRCTDVRTDPMACGACGNTCPTGIACVGGACQCPAGEIQCGASCTDTDTDAANCGGCDNACPDGIACVAGRCACPAGTSACGGSCVSLTSDENCGSCNNRCPTGVSCTDGRCPCPGGGFTCYGDTRVCTDFAGTYCGACDRTCGGTCTAGTCTCAAGQDRCERARPGGGSSVVCTDLDSDAYNCGACGRVCPMNETCVGGECRGCMPPYVECTDRTGPHCVDTQSDVDHCGGCGYSCRTPRGLDWCDDGRCEHL